MKYKIVPVRTSLILTNGYVAGNVLGNSNDSKGNIMGAIEGFNQLELEVEFTLGSLTSAEIKIEFSDNNTTFYQQAFSAISGSVNSLTLGVNTLIASGNYLLSLPISSKYIKISSHGTGTVTNSLLAITAKIRN